MKHQSQRNHSLLVPGRASIHFRHVDVETMPGGKRCKSSEVLPISVRRSRAPKMPSGHSWIMRTHTLSRLVGPPLKTISLFAETVEVPLGKGIRMAGLPNQHNCDQRKASHGRTRVRNSERSRCTDSTATTKERLPKTTVKPSRLKLPTESNQISNTH